jgi:DNA-binding response OmpR family regulator
MICNEVRRIGNDVPIIMLSVEIGIDKKVLLLESGADDYMTKPFSYKELLARIKAILRRPKTIEKEIIEMGEFTIDMSRQRAFRDSEEIYLTRKEFSLLEYLARHKGNVMSRGMIMEHVWDIDNDPFSNTLETHILNLRKKLGAQNKSKFIITVPGRGYMIETS